MSAVVYEFKPNEAVATVTRESITDRIAHVSFTRLEGEPTVICSIRMVNGHVVHGESYGVMAGGNEEQIAFNNAFDKLWVLEAYAAVDRKHREELAKEGAQ